MIGDDDARSPGSSAGTEKRRSGRQARSRPLGGPHVPPRVAAAAPGADAPHGRRHCRHRQHHARLQLGSRRQQRLRLGQPGAFARRLRSAKAPGGARLRQENVRDVRPHRPPLGSPSRAASRRWTTGRKPPVAPTPASCSRSGAAATQRGPARSHVTDGVAESLRLEIGSTLALDGRRRTVVGIVENPSKLSDEFALVAPSSASPEVVDLFVNASFAAHDDFMGSVGEPLGLHGLDDQGKRRQRDRRDVGDVLRGHRLPPPCVAGCRRRIRSRRAATAPPARHARRRRRHGEAPSSRALDQRRRRRDDRRGHRDDRGPRAVARLRPDARVRGRPSHRPAQPAVGPGRDGGSPRNRRSNRRRLVARANGRPPPRPARALGTTAQAEAGTALGDRGHSADRGRHRLSRPVRPGNRATDRRRAPGNDSRQPAPRPAGDPDVLRGGRACLDRAATGAEGPGALPGSVRSRARRSHTLARHRSDRRRHRLGRGGEKGE